MSDTDTDAYVESAAPKLTSTGDKGKDSARITLFWIDDVAYSMPATPPAGMILQYLRTLRMQGDDVASGELLENLIGEDAYVALMTCKDVGVDELGTIMNIVSEHSLGLIMRARGNSPAGPAR